MPNRCYPKEGSRRPIGSYPAETVAVSTGPGRAKFQGSAAQGPLLAAPAQGGGVLTALGRVLQRARDGDGRRVGRRESDEPSVRRTGRVLSASSLARHFDPWDLRGKRERARALDGTDEHG